jgi:hypothetical protein
MMRPASSAIPSHYPPRVGRSRRDSGQVTIEAAIVMPAMTFMTLVIIQLTLVQHARIMTDYAAYCAARAGIVFNGDPKAMQQAALVALAPTIGRSENLENLNLTMTNGVAFEEALRANAKVPMVQIQTFRPLAQDIQNLGQATDGEELDFDDIRPAAAAANVLQIRLHYYYNMKIPYANWILQGIFFAAKTSTLSSWNSNWGGENQLGYNMITPYDNGAGLRSAQANFSQSGGNWNFTDNTLVPAFAQIAQAAEQNHLYYVPLAATYSMRMQSNMFVKNAGPQIWSTP